MTSDLAERVARGAALLDEKRPGWAAEIAIDRLAMQECDSCILGQTYGHYLDALEVLGFDRPPTLGASHFGFNILTSDIHHPDWGRLADLWRAAIAERMALIYEEARP